MPYNPVKEPMTTISSLQANQFNPSLRASGLKQPVFGSVAAKNSLFNAHLKKAPLYQKMLGQLLSIKEMPKGLSHAKFFQETGLIWLPKMLVSRSATERFEISFLEFVESAYNYYCSPYLGEKVFKQAAQALSPFKVAGQYLTKPLAEVPKHLVKHVVPLKAATILSSVLMATIAGNYSLHFVKNLLTEKTFHQNKFSDVINLTAGKVENPAVDTEVSKKAKRRIKQCLGVGAGILAVSAFLARFGANTPMLKKPLEQFVKAFDFKYQNGKFGISRNQLLFFLFPVNIAGYVDAARDRLERVEVALRTIPVGLYVCGGADVLEDFIMKKFGKRYPGLVKAGQVQTLAQLEKSVMQQAKQQLQKQGKTFTQTQLRQAAQKLYAQQFMGKNLLYFTPLLFGMGVMGLGVGLFNRFFTQYRFEQERKKNMKDRGLLYPAQ